MKLSFAVKIPLRMRLEILFKGGIYAQMDYKGQHGITEITVSPIDKGEVVNDAPTGNG